MVENYRAIVNYYFKEGQRDEAIKFLSEELVDRAKKLGCHDMELLVDEKNPNHAIGTGVWRSVKEAKEFQSQWSSVEKDLMRYCSKSPERMIYKIDAHWHEKGKKAA